MNVNIAASFCLRNWFRRMYRVRECLATAKCYIQRNCYFLDAAGSNPPPYYVQKEAGQTLGGIVMAHASFAGLRVLSLESRRALEVEKLIRTYNGRPLIVRAMRELPLDSNQECLDFGEKLLAGEVDLVIFMTGVGVRAMLNILAQRHEPATIIAALGRIRVAARGSKPSSVLRELKIPVAAITVEPSTWREVLVSLEGAFRDSLANMRVAVQEYGATNPELIAELVTRCASVMKVPVYQWGLPEDTGPLRAAVSALL